MRPIPRWAVWLDALAIILVIVAVKIALSHSLRFGVGPHVFAANDPWRPLVAAVLVLAFRHWRVRSPTLIQRTAKFARGWREEPRASVLRVWAWSRFGVLMVAIVAALTIGVPPGMTQRVSDDPILDLPSRWDVPWYSVIAREGYSWNARAGGQVQQTVAFFPAYPMMLHVADGFTQPERQPNMTLRQYFELRESRLAWAGTAISIVFFLMALMIMYRWVEARGGSDAAATSILLLAAYPFAVFYSAAYTESLFLLATIGACFAFERERWVGAALLGLLAGLTRPNGCMLSLTLAVMACAPLMAPGDDRSLPRLMTRLLVAAMPGIGMLLYSAFIYSLTGDAFAWVKVQQAWGRSFATTVDYVEWTVRTIRNEGVLIYVKSAPVEILQTIVSLFALAMVWPVWRRLGAAYAVFLLANVLPPLLKGGVLSMGRTTSTLFPMFAALALTIPPWRRGVWVLVFALGQGLIAVLFFTWRPVY